MVFSSHIFIFYFLPAALLGYYAVAARYRHAILTLFSYFFYGWSNPLFTLAMAASTVIDYICGKIIDREPFDTPFPNPIRKRALIVSLVSNLSLLGFFKYFNFGLDSVHWALESAGISSTVLDIGFRVTLPLGISFYTFQSMSYTIDVYRGKVRAIHNFVDFACA